MSDNWQLHHFLRLGSPFIVWVIARSNGIGQNSNSTVMTTSKQINLRSGVTEEYIPVRDVEISTDMKRKTIGERDRQRENYTAHQRIRESKVRRKIKK